MTLQEAFPTGRTAWAILCPNSSGESPVAPKFVLSQNGNSPHLGAVAHDRSVLHQTYPRGPRKSAVDFYA